jgi:hypothetical protein
MKKVAFTFLFLASIFASTAQSTLQSTQAKENIELARKILVTELKLDEAMVKRACIVLEDIEIRKMKAIETFKDKPAELAKSLKSLSALKLNNLKGLIPAQIFSKISPEQLALLIK